MTLVTIDKSRVITENIESAIHSLFKHQYAAAINNICSASSILKDFLEDDSFRKTTTTLFPDIKKKEIYKELDSYWNFCKHANQDIKDNRLEINIDIKAILAQVMLTIWDYRAFKKGQLSSDIILEYELWFVATDKERLRNLGKENEKVILERYGKLYNFDTLHQINEGKAFFSN